MAYPLKAYFESTLKHNKGTLDPPEVILINN